MRDEAQSYSSAHISLSLTRLGKSPRTQSPFRGSVGTRCRRCRQCPPCPAQPPCRPREQSWRVAMNSPFGGVLMCYVSLQEVVKQPLGAGRAPAPVCRVHRLAGWVCAIVSKVRNCRPPLEASPWWPTSSVNPQLLYILLEEGVEGCALRSCELAVIEKVFLGSGCSVGV